MKRKAFTLIELLVVIAIIAILAAILFPVFAQAKRAAKKAASSQNNRQMALANIMYGADYDDTICVMINGAYRNLKNVQDGTLTQYGDQRTDGWPLLLLPYIKSRGLFVDPGRADTHNVFASPAHASADPGYDPYGATYRNQSRMVFYGVNYLFDSPLLIPSSKMSDATPTDFMAGEAHQFTEADDPSGTVFYTESDFGYDPTTGTDTIGVLDTTRGFFGVNAPGLWEVLVSSSVPYVIFWTGTNGSGDWCGDVDPTTVGRQKNTNFVYIGYNDGCNASFLDGHVKYYHDAALAAGTDYLASTPQDGGSTAFGGGANITDKDHYLWNLTNNYYGA
jgi:prepilin-type N-terminal cleavage/methylation domain-containing protein/prepilin-type processing-associated H-X9-DG protein